MITKMKHNLTPLLFAILCCIGCDTSDQPVSEEKQLLLAAEKTTSVSLLSEPFTIPAGELEPSKVIKYDSLLVALDPTGEYRMTVFNLNGRIIRQLLPAGSQPEGGLYFLNMQVSPEGVVSAYDFGRSRLVEIDLNLVAESGYAPTFTDFSGKPATLGAIRHKESFISTGLYEKGRYGLGNTGCRSYFLNYPVTGGHRSINEINKGILYASNCLAVQPGGSRFICTHMHSGSMEIAQISDTGIYRIKQWIFHSPEAVVRSRHTHPVAFRTENPHGFYDVAVTPTRIYALYSGRSYKDYKEKVHYGERIIVFDWDGNHIRNYSLSTPIRSLSYDPKTETLYGFVDGPLSYLSVIAIGQ